MAANGSKCSPSIFSCNSSLKAKAKDNEYRFQHYRFIYKILDTYYNTCIKKHETSLKILKGWNEHIYIFIYISRIWKPTSKDSIIVIKS